MIIPFDWNIYWNRSSDSPRRCSLNGYGHELNGYRLNHIDRIQTVHDFKLTFQQKPIASLLAFIRFGSLQDHPFATHLRTVHQVVPGVGQ